MTFSSQPHCEGICVIILHLNAGEELESEPDQWRSGSVRHLHLLQFVGQMTFIVRFILCTDCICYYSYREVKISRAAEWEQRQKGV